MIDFYQMLDVEFFIEVKLFAEDHPFIEIHLVALAEDLAEHASQTITLFAETLKSHL